MPERVEPGGLGPGQLGHPAVGELAPRRGRLVGLVDHPLARRRRPARRGRGSRGSSAGPSRGSPPGSARSGSIRPSPVAPIGVRSPGRVYRGIRFRSLGPRCPRNRAAPRSGPRAAARRSRSSGCVERPSPRCDRPGSPPSSSSSPPKGPPRRSVSPRTPTQPRRPRRSAPTHAPRSRAPSSRTPPRRRGGRAEQRDTAEAEARAVLAEAELRHTHHAGRRDRGPGRRDEIVAAAMQEAATIRSAATDEVAGFLRRLDEERVATSSESARDESGAGRQRRAVRHRPPTRHHVRDAASSRRCVEGRRRPRAGHRRKVGRSSSAPSAEAKTIARGGRGCRGRGEDRRRGSHQLRPHPTTGDRPADHSARRLRRLRPTMSSGDPSRSTPRTPECVGVAPRGTPSPHGHVDRDRRSARTQAHQRGAANGTKTNGTTSNGVHEPAKTAEDRGRGHAAEDEAALAFRRAK